MPLDALDDAEFLVKSEPGGMDDVDVWLMSTVAMIPMAAVLVHVVVYYAVDSVDLGRAAAASLILGPTTAVVLVGFLYWLYQRTQFNEAKHASVDMYNDLCVRMDHVASVTRATRGATPTADEAVAAARERVARCGYAFLLFREKRGLHWVLGKGYLDLLRLVHRCEEAVFMYAPLDTVISEGKRDLGRLTGSTIPRRDDLLQQIRAALLAVDPDATWYLATAAQAAAATSLAGGSHKVSAAAEPRVATPAQHVQARQLLRDVRIAVNEFRDAAKLRLVEARNNLVARMFLTALATSVLMIFIVLAQPPGYAVLAGAVLYSIGATVGLFARLYADRSNSFLGDYGISHVRLFQTFLVSGVAAVAGVYIAVVLPIVLGNQVPKSPETTSVTQTLPSVENLYDIRYNPASIAFAALFGLTPGLLISRLSEGVDKYRQDLVRSESGPAPPE